MGLKLEKLTRVENGAIVGPMCPVEDCASFIRECVNADVFAVWRAMPSGGDYACVTFDDNGETGCADLLIAAITGNALVMLLDFGTHCTGVALKNYGKSETILNGWRRLMWEHKVYNAPSDIEIRAAMNAIDAKEVINGVRLSMELSDPSTFAEV